MLGSGKKIAWLKIKVVRTTRHSPWLMITPGIMYSRRVSQITGQMEINMIKSIQACRAWNATKGGNTGQGIQLDINNNKNNSHCIFKTIAHLTNKGESTALTSIIKLYV